MSRWYPRMSHAAPAARRITRRPADTAWPRLLTPRACPEGSRRRDRSRPEAGPPPPAGLPQEAPPGSPDKLPAPVGGPGCAAPRPGSGDSPRTRLGAAPEPRARESAQKAVRPALRLGTRPETRRRDSAARFGARPARPPPAAAALDGKTPPSLGAAALENLPTTARLHSLTKAVRPLALATIRLVRALHWGTPPLRRKT